MRPPSGGDPPSATSGSVDIERRAFLQYCALLTLSLSGCSRVFSSTRFGRLALDRPHPDEYLPILRSLVRTILPFEHPRFPDLGPEALERRVLALFPLEHDEHYLALRRALVIFDAVDLFPEIAPPVALAERAALAQDAVGPAAAVDTAIAQLTAQDGALYAAFLKDSGLTGPGAFTTLAPRHRLGYLRLWGRSAFGTKRRFYQSAKALVMVTAYSTREFWSAIGYRGPLLERPS